MPLTYKSNWGGKNFTPAAWPYLPSNTQKHTQTPLPPQSQLVSQSPHNPTTSPQSRNLPTHMLAPTQICSHMGCFTHTNVRARAEPHMWSDFFPRSVSSFQLRWAGITAQRGAALASRLLTSRYPRWPPQLHPSAAGTWLSRSISTSH